MHFEWAYDTTTPDLTGYKIYHNNNPIVNVNDPLLLTLDWEVTLETGAVNTFTMTAYDASGNESSHSASYSIEVPPEDTNGNVPPVPIIKASVLTGEAPLSVDFDGSASYDFGGGMIVAHSWDFGDGDTSSIPLPSHTFMNPGSYTVWLVVTDDLGAASSAQTTITVTAPAGANAPPMAAVNATPTSGDAPLSVSFNASGSTDSDGSITLYSWDFGDGNSGSGQTASHTYTAAGTYSATITVTDDDGATDSALATITVNAPAPQNIPPTASVTATPLSGNAPLLVSFSGAASSDTDGSIISYSWDFGDGDIGSGATATHQFISGGTYTVLLTVTDNGGLSGQKQVTITVKNAPKATSSSVSTNEESPVSGTLIASDPDGSPLTYSIVASGSKGTATITNVSTGAFTYTPDTNATGADSFTFKANDGTADSNIATVSVTITAVNDMPVAADDTATTNEDTAATITVLANDTDADNDTLTVSAVTQGSKGTVSTNGTTVTYTPSANWSGTDSFTYTVKDGKGGTATATVNVTVSAVNDVPLAADDTAATNEDTAVTITVLANDTDADSDTLTVSAVTQGSKGAVATNGTTVTYSPSANWAGTDSFTYTIKDGKGGTATATVNITVVAVNSLPIANNAVLSVTEDVAAGGNLSATDAEGDPLTYSIVANGSKGKAVITNVSTGAFTYTPNANATGTDSFTFKVNDGAADSNTATISVTITAVNDVPVAADDTAATNEDTAVTITVLANDTDADSDTLTVSAVTQGSKGAVATNGTTVTYSPSANWAGTDSFTYTVKDGGNVTATAMVNVTVSAVNDKPAATAAGITVTEDVAAGGNLSATDAEGDPLTYSIVANGSKGKAIITNVSTGAFTYTPNANATGTDSFTFKVNDGAADSNTATISVTITAVNDVPVAADDTAATNEDTAVTITVLANDTDADNDTLTVSAVTQGSKGAVVTNGTTVTYTPGANWAGTDSFTYTIKDGNGGTATATVKVTVNAVPVATGSNITASEDSATTGTLSAADQDNVNLTYSIVSNGTLGTAVITDSAAGNFTYTPNPNISGTDSFTFLASDGKASSQSATVTVTISPVNDPPSAVDDLASTTVNMAVSITVLGNDSDIDDETLAVTAVTAGANGSVTFDSQKVTYTPGENFSGTDNFTYTVEDPQGGKGTATVTVEVQSTGVTLAPTPRTDTKKERNRPPVASNSQATVNEDILLRGMAVATDPEGGTLTYILGTTTTHGSLTLNPATGGFAYMPALNYSGTDSFTFSVSDGQFKSKTGTVSITVQPVNDPPLANPDSVIIDSGTQVSINVLANDLDVENDTLIISKVANGAHGVTGISGNKIMYTPEPGYYGTDEFSYEASDGKGGMATGKVTITLLQVNDRPTANSSTVTVAQNVATKITLSATDPENDPLTYAIIDRPVLGTVSGTEVPNIYLYTPNENATGADSFTFTASDGTSTSDKATVTITIAAKPVASAGGPYFGFVGSAITFSASGSSATTTRIALYEWDWNNDGIFDGKVLPPATTIEHVWAAPYMGNISLRITDDLGATSTAGAAVTVIVQGDQDGDNDFDATDIALFEKNYPIALGNCAGSRNYSRPMDLNIDGCVNEADLKIFQSLSVQ